MRIVLLPLLIAFLSPPADALFCAGDCNGDGRVDLEELVRSSEIILEHDSLPSCLAGDVDEDGQITADELTRAIVNSLSDCPSPFGAGQGTTAGTIAASHTSTVPGGRATLSVQLLPGEGEVAALQHDLGFNPFFTPVARREVGTVLLAALVFEDTEMLVADASGFPPFGVVRIGDELIAYSAVDPARGSLTIAGRGARNTKATIHQEGAPIEPAAPIPDCAGERGIRKKVVFSFLPRGCEPGLDCTAIRALAVSLDRTEPIAGPQIYTCNVDVSPAAPLGEFPLTLSNARAGDGAGNPLSLQSADGSIFVEPGTPTLPPTPTPTATPEVRIQVGVTAASQGQAATVGVTLQTSGVPVAAVRHFIFFDPSAAIAAAGRLPDCTVNPEIGKPLFAVFLPRGCTPSIDCSGIEAQVVDFENFEPIADGSTLYSCRIQVAADAPLGRHALPCEEPLAFNSDGEQLPLQCISGEVFVDPQPSPTVTPTPEHEVLLEIGSAVGGPRYVVTAVVSLLSTQALVTRVENNIVFSPSISVVLLEDGRPDCAALFGYDNSLDITLVPEGCTSGFDCIGVRAFVSRPDFSPIPSGSPLYACRLRIAASAFPGTEKLVCLSARAFDAFDQPLDVGCADGEVLVSDSFFTPTDTPVLPTRTPTPVFLTRTPTRTFTRTSTRAPSTATPVGFTPTPNLGDRDNDFVPDELDGCPDVYDPEQVDGDRDGIGDACDPCLSGTILLAPQSLALDGDPASGAEPGATLSSYASPEGEGPIIGPTGRVVFPAVVAAPDSTFAYSLWAGEKRDSLVEIVRAGEAAPGAGPGVMFSTFEFDVPAIDGRGRVAFRASLNVPDQSFANGIWVGRSKAELTNVALTGLRAPGTADGVRYSGFFGLPAMNPAGTLAFYADVSGPGPEFGSGIWSGEGADSLRAVVVTGDAAPGVGPNVTFVGFSQNQSSSPLINGAGAVAFVANIAGPGVDFTNDSGIWLGDADALTLIVRAGDPAPGFPGLAFDAFYSNGVSVDVNDAGQVAFLARVTSGDYGIWIADAGRTLRLLAATGQPVPGTEEDTVFTTIRDLRINARGTVVFFAELLGFFDESIWVGSSADDLRLVARSDDRAPGTPNDAVFARFRPPSINSLGQVIFAAEVREPGFGFFGSALFAFDPIGGLGLIAGDGDLLEASSCAASPLSGLLFQSGAGGEDGIPAGLNDRGEVVFLASLGPSAAPPPGGAGTGPDGPTGGVFTVTVPHRSRCPADCGDDGEVTLDELVVGVGIASGSQRIERCAAIDTNRDGLVGIDELVFAVAIAMNGCPPVLEAEFTASPCFTNSEGETQCFPIKGSALLIPSGPATPGEHRSTFVLPDDDLPRDCRFVCTPSTSPRCGFRGDTTATISGSSLSQRTTLVRTLTAFCDGCRLEQDYRAVVETEAEVSDGTSRTELVGRVIASCQSTGDRCPFVEDFLDCESGVLRGTLNLRLVE